MMSPASRFCTYCGSPLPENDRFCGQCGQVVPAAVANAEAAQEEGIVSAPPPPAEVEGPAARAAAVPPAPPPPAARPGWNGRQAATGPATPVSLPDGGGEPVLGIVASVVRRYGFLGVKSDSYSIVVTPQRLVFAYIAKDTMNAAIREANAEAKAKGKGALGVIAAQMRWLDVISRKLAEMPVNAIFQQYPGSFQVNNNEVRRIRFYESGGDEDNAAKQRVTFETTGGKLDYELVGTSEKAAKAVLAQTLMPAIR